MENDIVLKVYSSSLNHYGVKGMKWGVIRSKKLSTYVSNMRKGGKKLSSKVREMSERKKMKKIKKLKVSSKSKDINKMTPGQRDELRKAIKNSNDPAKVYQYRRLFNDAEIKSFASRFENEGKIKGRITPKKSKGAKIIDAVVKVEKNVKTVTNAAESIKKNIDKMNKLLPKDKQVDIPDVDKKVKKGREIISEIDRNIAKDPDYYKEVRDSGEKIVDDFMEELKKNPKAYMEVQ